MKRSPIFIIFLLGAIAAYWDYAKYIILAIALLLAFRMSNRIYRLVLNIINNHRLKDIDVMDGIEFEKYVGKILKKNDYTNIHFTEKYDYGVDIIATKDGIRWGIQVKRCSRLVKADAIRQVVAGLNYYGCERAMIIANSVFSRVAVLLAESNDCVFIDRSGLAKMIKS